MVRARLDLTLPDTKWVGRVSRAFPDAEFSLLAGLPVPEGAVELGAVRGTDLDRITAAIAADPDVVTFDLLHATDDRALAQYRTTDPGLYDLAAAAGVAPVYPLVVRDGHARLELSTPHERLSAVADALDAERVGFRVRSVTDEDPVADLLTARQREVVEAAIERGYYDTPRRTTLTALAGHLGVDKSSLSETLHRAEGSVMKSVLSGEGVVAAR